jgi:hypothetical protein
MLKRAQPTKQGKGGNAMLSTQRTLLLLSILAMLMSAAWAQELTKQGKNKASAAAATVSGSGTAGRISKWTGVSGSNTYVLGNSNIFEDKFGKVGIGTETPTSLLTVQGMIETTLGGYKFPDGTVQTTAGIASSDVVRSLNTLKGDLLLVGGANITVSPAGNTITVAAPNVLTRVAHDNTLTGEGTAASPLSIVQSASQIQPIHEQVDLLIDDGVNNTNSVIYTVPAGKRLVIEHVSSSCLMPLADDFISELFISAVPSQGVNSRRHSLVPFLIGSSTAGKVFNASTPMKLYAHSNTEVRATVFRTSFSNVTSCRMSISGFLVDLP